MKSHFQFSNQQRNGIFLLVLIIVLIQSYLWLSKSSNEVPVVDKELEELREELDSLSQVKIETNQPKIFPFNPNFITDYKGYTLGMSNEEIDRLQNFRASNKWINSKEQFQKVTGISDSLLNEISPYFKFPDWVTKPKPNSQYLNEYNDISTSIGQKIDLNTATQSQLTKIYGIGDKLAQRIITYRNKFDGGFHSIVELFEVYGLKPEVIERVKKEFIVKTPRKITKINLNKASRDELVTIKYIDYEVANNIVEERTLRQGFKSLEELTKVEDFPLHKIEIIKLYLHL